MPKAKGKQKVVVRWSRLRPPMVEHSTDVEVSIVDSDLQDSFLMEHNGRKFYRAVKDKFDSSFNFSEHYATEVPLTSIENVPIIALRRLRRVPRSKQKKYRTMYPFDAVLQRLAYSMDIGAV